MKYNVVFTAKYELDAECIDQAIERVQNKLGHTDLDVLSYHIIGNDATAEFDKRKN